MYNNYTFCIIIIQKFTLYRAYRVFSRIVYIRDEFLAIFGIKFEFQISRNYSYFYFIFPLCFKAIFELATKYFSLCIT